MEANLTTHLTEKVMDSLLENPGKKIKSIVQLLDVQQKNVNNRTLVTAVLSDGSFSDSFIVFPNIQDNFLQLAKPRDVLDVGLVRKEHSSTFTLLYEFRVIYSEVPHVIGSPVQFKVGAENPLGNAAIPDEVIFGRPNEASRPGGQLLEEERAPPKVVLYKIESDNEEGVDHFTEIANLNHYDRSFKIRGRVIKKNPMRGFKRKDGADGFVFSAVLADESRAIMVTFFNELAQKYFGLLEEGKVYSLSDAEIRTAGRFNMTDNKFELSVHERTEIRRMPDVKEIPAFHFNLVKISEIQDKSENDSVDLIALVEDEGMVKEIQLKTGELKEKRSMRLCDDSGFSIELTIWGRQAVENVPSRNAIVLVQDAKVKVFMGGKTLSLGQNSQITTKIPDVPRYKELLLFKNSDRSNPQKIKSLNEGTGQQNSDFVKISQMLRESEVLTFDENGKYYFTVVAHVSRFVGNLFYESCENENCHKKVLRNPKGLYECEKCKRTFERPKHRFMASVKFADDSGNFLGTVTGDENCQMIFRKSLEEIVEMKQKDERDYIEFLKESLFEEFRVRLSCRKEVWNEESRIKFQIYKLYPLMNTTDVLLPVVQKKLEE